MSTTKSENNSNNRAPYTAPHQAQQYPEALPSNYDPGQQNYAQYYGEYPQESAPQQPQGYANTEDKKRSNAGQNNAVYETPNNPPNTAAAAPAYYDYTVPQSFGEVSKFNGQGKWATGLCCAPCKDPCFCVSAFCCPCCCTFMQRKKLMMDDWSRYRCCAGICGQCLCLGSNCGKCAPCCMVMETLFCLACSVHGNRFMVMQHYGLQTECCDCVIMWAACILQIVGMIAGCDAVQSAADCFYLIVLSCMLTQNEYQMKKFSYPSRSAMA